MVSIYFSDGLKKGYLRHDEQVIETAKGRGMQEHIKNTEKDREYNLFFFSFTFLLLLFEWTEKQKSLDHQGLCCIILESRGPMVPNYIQ